MDHAARIETIRWLGARGFNSYAYAPKNDPLHRERWREPYPADGLARFAEMIADGAAVGVSVGMVISPGLDWRGRDDADDLLRKMESFANAGARVLGVAFDDVPPGGADLGASHAAGVADAIARLGDGFRFIVCPTDYATDGVTPYLRTFCDGLPTEVDIMWTGPSIVSPFVDGAMAQRWAKGCGRPPLFAENYPVNDGPMAGVLHVGPYRGRAHDLPGETRGVFFNFMHMPLASRIGLACGARFWQDQTTDPNAAWTDAMSEIAGIEPLARASRSWIGDPGPDAHLAGMVERAIAGDAGDATAYVEAGCREGLDPAVAREIEPWLLQWDAETVAWRYALMAMQAPESHRLEAIFAVGEAWARARCARAQLFGIRWAYYPVTERVGDRTVAHRDALIQGENLTDRLCRYVVEDMPR